MTEVSLNLEELQEITELVSFLGKLEHVDFQPIKIVVDEKVVGTINRFGDSYFFEYGDFNLDLSQEQDSQRTLDEEEPTDIEPVSEKELFEALGLSIEDQQAVDTHSWLYGHNYVMCTICKCSKASKEAFELCRMGRVF